MTSNGQAIQMDNIDLDAIEPVEEPHPRPKWKQFLDRNGRYVKGFLLIVIALTLFLIAAVMYALGEDAPPADVYSDYKRLLSKPLEEDMKRRTLPIMDEEFT